MKAIVIHGPRDARYEIVPVKKLRDKEVLIKIEAVGLCHTDYELFTNDMAYIKNGLCKLPMIPGHEWSGTIQEIGKDVKDFNVGDKVTGECTISCGQCEFCRTGHPNMCKNRTETGVLNRDGAFAEYISFPSSHLHTFENISFEEAALIEPTAIAMYAVERSHVSPLDNVLILGPGPIGLQCAQIVKRIYGAKKIIISGTRNERLELAKAYDLDGYVNIRKENLYNRVREITNGEMIDTVIETSGGDSALEDIKNVIKPCGKVSMVGFFGAKKPQCDWDSFITRDITIYGALGSPNVWKDTIGMVESGKLDTKNLITHSIDMKSYDDFKNALDIMVERKENVCKIILKP